MSEKLTFRLLPKPHPARENACAAIREAPDGYIVTISEPTRNLAQNAKLWALLTDISRQVKHVGLTLSPESWKDLFTASWKKQTVIPNLDGDGFVICALSTSAMSKREFAELIEVIYAFGASKDVRWSEPVKEK